jgi:hypothetical protein
LALVAIAEGNGMHDHSEVSGSLHLLFPAPLMVLTVGDHHHNPAAVSGFVVEGIERRFKSGSEVRSRGFDATGSKGFQDLNNRSQIRRQGTTDHSPAREGHDPDPIAGIAADHSREFLSDPDGIPEPIGNHILGRHAPTDVDGQDQISPRGERHGRFSPPSRLGQCNDENRHRQQPRGSPIARRASRLRKGFPIRSTTASGEKNRHSDHRHDRNTPEPERLDKFQRFEAPGRVSQI